MTRKLLRIAILVDPSLAFDRNVLQGIAGYATANGPWAFQQREQPLGDTALRQLKDWKADGVIARVATPKMAEQLGELGLPTVDIHSGGLLKGCPRVLVNHREVMQLAIDHLRSCGFQHFAFIGLSRMAFSQERSQCFADHVVAWGCEPNLFNIPFSKNLHNMSAAEPTTGRHALALVRWLRRLPKPLGVVACNDIVGQWTLSVCGEHKFDIPNMLGVIGVDNDEVQCALSCPSLSSIDPNSYHVGYEAAALVQRLVKCRHASEADIIVDPTAVVARRSTDVWAFADPEISDTIRFIRDHACENITLAAILRHAKVSRATLDRQFLKHLGHTAKAEITRVRVQHARELLAMTDLPLKQIARRVGFKYVETMCRLLRRATNQTPSEYRRATCRSNSWPRRQEDPYLLSR
jgi:LacI family transcriptional regulator